MRLGVLVSLMSDAMRGSGKAFIGEPWTVGDSLVGERVTTFVFGVSGVAFHPMPGNAVRCGGVFEAFPKVAVFHWLVCAVLPTFFAPGGKPAFGHGIDEILGIRMEFDVAGFLEFFESVDSGAQFHPVVGGEYICGAEFQPVRRK